jgi:hypothetical protein
MDENLEGDDAEEKLSLVRDPDYQEDPDYGSTSDDSSYADPAEQKRNLRTGLTATAMPHLDHGPASSPSPSAPAAPAVLQEGWKPDATFFAAIAQVKKEELASPPSSYRFVPDQPSVVASCDFARGIYDHEVWDAVLSPGGSTVDMVVRGKGKAGRQESYSVPVKRANKALRTLHPQHILLTLTKPCGCTKACNTSFSYHDIASKRKWYLSFASELDSRTGLVQDLLPKYDKKKQRLHYSIPENGIDVAVCSNFYMQALGVGETKMVRVRASVRHGGVIFIHGNKHKAYKTEAQKASRTRAFWREYYPIICQVVENRNVVLPEGTVISEIYRMNFVPWWRDRGFKDKAGNPIGAPCLRTFSKEGNHPDFGHIKKRAKHTHLKCSTCYTLRAEARLGFRDGEDVDKYVLAFRAHQGDVRQWRETENYWQTIASNMPHKYITVLGDDTSALGFPHLTNRDYKSVATKHRVKFVPWLFHNFASDEQIYVYSLKNKFKKVTLRV